MKAFGKGFVLPAAAIMLALGILLGRSGAQMLPAAAALGLAVLGAAVGRGRFRLICGFMAVMAFGSVIGWQAYHPVVPEEGTYTVTGIVSDEIVLKDRRIPARLTNVTLDGKPAPTDAYWSFYTEKVPENLRPGMQVTFTGRLYIPMSADNPHGFDFREYLLADGIVYAVYGAENMVVSDPESFSLTGTAAEIRHDLICGLQAVLDDRAGGYAAAMLLGSKTLIPEGELDAFAETGAAHILAVSGFHTGILAAMVAFVLRGSSIRLRAAVTTAALLAYCILTGANAPVMRAAILVELALYGRLRYRQVNSLYMLSAAFILMLLYRPAQLTSAGFQLSFASVLGIITVEPVLRKMWKPKNRMAEKVWSALRVSLGAQIGVLLPLLYWYHEFPLAGFLLNLVLIPYAGVLVVLFWLVLLTLWVKPVCLLLAFPAKLMTELMLEAILRLDATGAGMIWTGSANGVTLLGWVMLMLACSAVMSKTGRKRITVMATGAAVMIASLIPLPHTGTDYIQLAAGAADAAVLHDAESVVVIDAGEDGTLADYLHAERLPVDMLVISHMHGDHTGGIRALVANGIPVAACGIPYGADTTEIDAEVLSLLVELEKTGTEFRVLSRGDVIPLPSGRIEMLWPEEGRVRPGRDANISSMAVRATVRGVSLLSMGDLYGAYEHYCAVPADILKAAHHGDKKSTLEPFLQAVAPSAVIVPSGSGTFDADTADRLGGYPVYATHEMGAITVTFEDGTYTISTEK